MSVSIQRRTGRDYRPRSIDARSAPLASVRLMDAVDAETVARFQADGYVVTDGLLSIDDVERYGRAIDRAVASRTAGDDRSLADKTPYEQSFVQCMRLWETDADVRPLVFHPVLAELAGTSSRRRLASPRKPQRPAALGCRDCRRKPKRSARW